MSTKVMNWAWHDPATEHLRGNAAMVLLALADIATDDGQVIYAKGPKRSQEALAKKSRVSVATFRRVTALLVAEGFLEVTRESKRTENEYRVLMTAQDERSGVSGQSAHSYERSERSSSERSTATTPLKGRSDVRDISLSPDESDDGTLIPADWRPNQKHIDKAGSLHLDVRREYQSFRAHAERKHRRLKDWNQGFTNWLRKQAEFAQQRGGAAVRPAAPMPADRANDLLELGRQMAQERDGRKAIAS